jgi:hypothetical protein
MPFGGKHSYYCEAIDVFGSAGLSREPRSLFLWDYGGEFSASACVGRASEVIPAERDAITVG